MSNLINENTVKPVKIVDTTLRDGQQSLIATRMRIEEMEPILTKMDNIGFHGVEVWGGATFDASMRFLKEDPWERLRTLKKHFKKTKLQMLFRGQNGLGYKCFADDVIEALLRKSVENGIDIVRVFDALNDLRNIESSVKALKKEKAEIQLAICYTLSEVHTIDYFTKLAKSLEDMGADSICIKDMAGLLLPDMAYKLTKKIKENVKVPIQIHSHYTSGLAGMSYLKAIEAGADIIDTAMSPFAMGTSQPATEVMVAALEGTQYDTGLKNSELKEITDYFNVIREKAIESGLLNPKVLGVDIETLLYQVPGGMLSNLVSQLKQQNSLDKFSEVLSEIARVRADMGYPPLVTPSSQIVGTQAVMNVLMGERFKMVPKETKDLVRGMYGKTPIEISKEIRKQIIGDEEPITCKPADLIPPQMAQFSEEIKDLAKSEEDVLSYAVFPQVATEYFKYRQAKEYGVDPSLFAQNNTVYPI